MCNSGKKNQPSMICLVPLALLCMIMGGGLVGTWVACYYECLTGRLIEYNYYVAVWTGGIAVFSGLLQLFLGCCWNKPLKYFMLILNMVLVLCCLACAALTGYTTYREAVLYNALTTAGTPPSLGTILTGLETLLAVFLLLFVIIWNCVVGCSGSDDYPEVNDSRKRRQTHNQSQQRGVRGPYDEAFFNREPIYQGQQEFQERPQEVMYGQPGSSRTRGKGTNYVIPRASANGQGNNGYHSNERAMVVDGRESYRGIDNPKGFYTGSSRPVNQNGGAYQNETGTFRAGDLGSRPGDLTNNRYSHGINLMQMHGVAPTTNHITQGYY